MERTCKKCGETKPIEEFVKDSNCKNGYKYTCLICRKEYAKSYRQNNKELIKEHEKEYYENNKEQIKIRKKKYRQNNKELIKQYEKKYRQNNAELLKKRQKKYRLNNKELIRVSNEKYRQDNAEFIKEYRQINSGTLSDVYIRQLLRQRFGLVSQDIKQYPELIEIHRQQIYHTRESKQLLKKLQNEESTNS